MMALMTDDAPMTVEARQVLFDVIDRAWSNPSVSQVQVLFRHRAHAEVSLFTQEQESGGKNSEAAARTLLISMGAERGQLYWTKTRDETVGAMRWLTHSDSGSRVAVTAQYAIEDRAPALT